MRAVRQSWVDLIWRIDARRTVGCRHCHTMLNGPECNQRARWMACAQRRVTRPESSTKTNNNQRQRAPLLQGSNRKGTTRYLALLSRIHVVAVRRFSPDQHSSTKCVLQLPSRCPPREGSSWRLAETPGPHATRKQVGWCRERACAAGKTGCDTAAGHLKQAHERLATPRASAPCTLHSDESRDRRRREGGDARIL